MQMPRPRPSLLHRARIFQAYPVIFRQVEVEEAHPLGEKTQISIWQNWGPVRSQADTHWASDRGGDGWVRARTQTERSRERM